MTTSALNLIPVELTCAGVEPALRVRALLTAFSDRIITLRLQEDLRPLPVDTGVVLCLEDRPMEIVGLVEAHTVPDLTVRITRVTHREKRYYPREYGGIELRWRRLPPETRADGPVETLLVDDRGEWHQPNPFMNFSASGLRFRDAGQCEAGDRLQLLFRLDGQSVWHQATATVVRSDPGPDGESEVAVAFEDIAPASIQALADFTLDCQLAELARHRVMH